MTRVSLLSTLPSSAGGSTAIGSGAPARIPHPHARKLCQLSDARFMSVAHAQQNSVGLTENIRRARALEPESRAARPIRSLRPAARAGTAKEYRQRQRW